MSEFRLPVALYPTAAQDRLTEGQIADMFGVNIHHVRAMMSFTCELLVSRAIEGGYIKRDWTPKSANYALLLDELSRAILGHWSKLLSDSERDERRHVQFVLRVLRRQCQPESKRHAV